MFGGKTYIQNHDSNRLTSQLHRVHSLMKDQQWRTLQEILNAIGAGSLPGISARLRDFRKPKFQEIFGYCEVERRRRGDPKLGLFEYRLIKDESYKPDDPYYQKYWMHRPKQKDKSK